MSRRTRVLILGILIVATLGGAAWWWYFSPEREPVVREVPRSGGLDITLLALSDLHFGSTIMDLDANGNERWIDAMPVRRTMAGHMKRIAGKPYPPAIGGSVAPPWSLLITGDLTEDGKQEEWDQFTAFFGLPSGVPEPKPTAHTKPPGPADRMPVFECVGNHDRHRGEYVTRQVAARHGDDYYSLDYGDLHLASMGAGPDEAGLKWLKRDLAATGRQRPVILYMHYPLVGPFSDSWWTTRPALMESFAQVIGGFNVIAILHGHYHVPGCYQWRGLDVYNIGSLKHGARCFGVIHVTDHTFTFASWNSPQDSWWWWHHKPINIHAGQDTTEILDQHVTRAAIGRSAIPYPTR
jgi:hypothetical protein